MTFLPPAGPRNAAAGLSALGRNGDTTVAHVTPGEVVIPVSVTQDPRVAGLLGAILNQHGKTLDEFVVGHPGAKTNPTSGAQEFYDSFGMDDGGSISVAPDGSVSVDGFDVGFAGGDFDVPNFSDGTDLNAPVEAYAMHGGNPASELSSLQTVGSYAGVPVSKGSSVPGALEASLIGMSSIEDFAPNSPGIGYAIEDSAPNITDGGALTGFLAAEDSFNRGPAFPLGEIEDDENDTFWDSVVEFFTPYERTDVYVPGTAGQGTNIYDSAERGSYIDRGEMGFGLGGAILGGPLLGALGAKFGSGRHGYERAGGGDGDFGFGDYEPSGYEDGLNAARDAEPIDPVIEDVLEQIAERRRRRVVAPPLETLLRYGREPEFGFFS